MRTTRAMRKLASDLLEGARLTPPADAGEIIGALCTAYAGRRGGERKVDVHFTSFPPDTASGLWLELDDVDLIVVEQHTRPEHQLVIACHELWHLDEGTSDSVGPGMLVAARLAGHPGRLAELLASESGLEAVVRQVAARADQGDPDEVRAETFGLHLGNALRSYLPSPREQELPEDIERIKSSLGWGSPVPRRDAAAGRRIPHADALSTALTESTPR
ncbi:toxin-antitoxin system, toxin component [Streptomyces sp. NPDC058682]|uniref:toxin-antitoxin system, toxin component n=1 Tax=unclassified Streptomyces TaxID=2593676 RepID=UPI002258996C|nr:toxin-antitoxin system, toxin component [Streptomyces sp. NBC_01214]MCX4806766.1 toxin-antitoxin system, toxin component [Streptomyces sp. NBC_01214]